MAKNAITDYSTTAASNTDAGGVDIQGTAPASNMDDSVREVMSHLAETNAGTAPWADTMTIGDAADLTKELRFELSAITAGQTRVVTMPDADVTIPSGTLVTESATQTLAAKTLTSPVLTTPQINDTTADHQYVFAVSELAADRTITLPLLLANDVFVFAGFIQTLTNKKLEDGTTTIVGSVDATKAVKFEVDGLTTATTRTVTVPDKNGTLAMTSDIVAPDYGAGYAALAYGAIGTTVLGYRTSGVTENSTYAGSSIEPAGFSSGGGTITDDNTAQAYLTKGGSALSGTWRAHGRINVGSHDNYVTQFVRIS